ncbi:MAG TPA: M24 family metallopeptidase [Gaiellaceae bacterium]|nr:M24 family metallopeptidase [Gaiellaceae bacterium]
MGDVLIYADTIRSPELRHEVPVAVGDPFLYVERDGVRHIVISTHEIPIISPAGEYVFHPPEEFGIDELRRTARSYAEMANEITVRAVKGLGVERATVPASFPLLTADKLRAAGVELNPDHGFFTDRRRVKTGAELAGIRRAQAAAGAGMAAAASLLRRSSADHQGVLELDGRPLTVEELKAAISGEFMANGASADEFVVSHGAQAAIGHHLGHGKIRASETIVIDLWPRDSESGCFADMSRTFVVGEVPDEIAEWHRLSVEAHELALAAVRPGITGRSLYDLACEVFEREGHLTQRTKIAGETAQDGFLFALGHGVGLEVHELPILGILGHDELVAGDVLAIEPGVYRGGFGGLRVEDLVLVTDDGYENLTHFPYDLAP